MPHHLVKTLLAPVEMISPVVRRQSVFLSIKRKFPACDPIADTPDQRRRGWISVQIRLQVLFAQYHVDCLAVLVRHLQIGDDPTISNYFGAHSFAVAQSELLYGLALLCFAEVLFLNALERRPL